MENAVKALMIAASIFMALLVIGVLLFTYNKISNVEQSKTSVESEEKLRDFGQRFAQYEKNVVYGTEIMSLANLLENYNETQRVMKNYPDVSIKVTLKEPVKIELAEPVSINGKVVNTKVYLEAKEYNIKTVKNQINKKLKQDIEAIENYEETINTETKTLKEWSQIRLREVGYYMIGGSIVNIADQDLDEKLRDPTINSWSSKYIKLRKEVNAYEQLLSTYTTFKTTAFKCKKFKKRDDTQVGIVDYMEFEQK